MRHLTEIYSHVRSELYQGVLHYSVIDVVALLFDTDRRHASNYYYVLKNRLRKNQYEMPYTVKIKALSSDGKTYFTEFTDIEGIELLRKYIDPSTQRREARVNIRQQDEIIIFHPKVISYLRDKGWQVNHHVGLPSGNIIDLVALCSPKDAIYVIECKPELKKNKLYQAIGQVLCYCHEYGNQALPAIASYCSETTNMLDYSVKHWESRYLKLSKNNL